MLTTRLVYIYQGDIVKWQGRETLSYEIHVSESWGWKKGAHTHEVQVNEQTGAEMKGKKREGAGTNPFL